MSDVQGHPDSATDDSSVQRAGSVGRPPHPAPADLPAGRDDREAQVFLDELFEAAVSALEGGAALDAAPHHAARPELRERIDEVLDLAAQVGIGPADPSDAPEVAGYAILRRLGRGGMGAVYLAAQQSLGGRLVALKVLPQATLGSHRARERFQLEANAVARLQHPNIVAVHDIVKDAHAFAFAMDFVDGESLQALIDHLAREHSLVRPASTSSQSDRAISMDIVRGFLVAPDGALTDAGYEALVCRWGIAIARALHVVHSAGLLHRDVKPSNILLRRDGAALLSDFGLVRDDASSILTQHDAFVGTPAYAPPEQLAGGNSRVDARSDVYALGATLYHAVALRLPFNGRSHIEILKQIESGPAPGLCSVTRRATPDLDTIIATAMDPDPARRYPTAAALADDLERLLSLRPIRARPATTGYLLKRFVVRNRVLVGAVVCVILALIAGLVGVSVGLRRAVDARRLADLSAARSELNAYVAGIQAAAAAIRLNDVTAARTRLDSAPGSLRGWEWTYLDAQVDRSDLELGPSSSTPSVHGFVRGLSVAPDGQRVAVTWMDTLTIYDASTGRVLVESEVRTGPAGARAAPLGRLAWRGDGSELLVSSTYDARLLRVDAGDLSVVESLPSPQSETTCGAFSPDGMMIAVGGGFWAERAVSDRQCLIVDAASGQVVRTLTELPSRTHDARWSPDGSRLLLAVRGGARLYDTSDWTHRDFTETRDSRSEAIAWSPDGTRFAIASGGSAVVREAAGGAVVATLAGVRAGLNWGLAFSPDGTVLHTSQDAELVSFEVGTGRRVYTGRGARGSIFHLAASPDGRSLWTGDGAGQVRRWPLDDVGDALELAARDNAVPSPDFRWIAHSSPDTRLEASDDVIVRDGVTGVEVERLELGRPSAVNGLLVWSPDGTRLLRAQHGGRLSMIDLAGRKTTEIVLDDPDGIPAVEFVGDGWRMLARTADALVELDGMRLTVTRAIPLEVDGARHRILAVGRSGLRAVCAISEEEVVVVRIIGGSDPMRESPLRPGGRVTAARFAPDGTRLALAAEGTITLWDASTGERLAEAALASTIDSVAFTPDGSRVFAPQRDGTVRVLGVLGVMGLGGVDEQLQLIELMSLRAGSYWMSRVEASSDGTRLFGATVWPANRCFVWSALPLRPRAVPGGTGPE